MLKALLFDFDGVLAESEPVHLDTFKEIVAPLGIKISDRRWYSEFVGVGSPHIMKTLLSEKGITDDTVIRKYVESRRELFQQRILDGKLQLKKGIVEFLQNAKKKGLKTAIVSGGHRSNIEVAVSVMKIEKYFDVIIGREDYEKRKPDPQCYLMAAEKLGIVPADCIAFEDAISGCLAAKAAGMIRLPVTAPIDVEMAGCKPDMKIKDFSDPAAVKLLK